MAGWPQEDDPSSEVHGALQTVGRSLRGRQATAGSTCRRCVWYQPETEQPADTSWCPGSTQAKRIRPCAHLCRLFIPYRSATGLSV